MRVSPLYRSLARVLSVLGLLLFTSAANAQEALRVYPHFIFPICLEDLVVIKVPPIVVGCEVIDCCPGCPGPWPLDWRIRVEGPVQEVALRFDGLPVAPQTLEVKGAGRWGKDNTLTVSRGETMLRGIPGAPSARPVRVQPEVLLDAGGIPADSGGAAPAKDGSPPAADARIIVEQLRGGIVVNERVILYRVRRCPPRPVFPRTDRVDLRNNAGSDNAVVFLDARRSGGCVNDEIDRGSGLFAVGSVLSNGGCRSEAAVFSDDDAVQLLENVTTWTDPLGDRLPADLTPDRWQAPVDVWITQTTLQTRSQNEMAQGDLLLNTNHAGVDILANVRFQPLPTTANAATINTTAGNVWNTGTCTVGAITGNPAIFTAGRINVYFVNQAFTGWWCPGSNVIAIGTTAQPESLAHEFGHAFSLAHTNGVDYDLDGANDFPNTNIMWGGGVGRTTFTEGQCFRMTLNPGSMLNVNGVRTAGPLRTCADATIGPGCPWIARDAVPN